MGLLDEDLRTPQYPNTGERDVADILFQMENEWVRESRQALEQGITEVIENGISQEEFNYHGKPTEISLFVQWPPASKNNSPLLNFHQLLMN